MKDLNFSNPIIKGGIMLLLTSFLSLLTDFPATSIDWYVFVFTTLGTIFLYFAQSGFFPTTSQTGEVNLKDLLKALLVALGNGLSSFASTTMAGGVIEWKPLFLSMGGMFLGYLIKQYSTP